MLWVKVLKQLQNETIKATFFLQLTGFCSLRKLVTKKNEADHNNLSNLNKLTSLTK